MDASTALSRTHFPSANQAENGTLHLDAAENEAAKRMRWYEHAYELERANAVANHLPRDRAMALKAQLQLMHQMEDAIHQRQSIFSGLTPELAELQKSHQVYKDLFERETVYRRTSGTTQAWNSFAGLNGFILCFGPGTLISSGLKMPWLALAISPLVWTLTERLIPMIRATSWPNKYADQQYPLIMRVNIRVGRDFFRKKRDLDPKKYMVNGQVMTASQRRETLSLCKAWKGKVMTDDLPYYSYTFWYSLRSVILLCTATAAFSASNAYLPVSLITLAIAGGLAGASTSLIFQAARRCAHRKENPTTWRDGETIVKTRSLWEAEKKVLEAKMKLLEAFERAFGERTTKSFTLYKATLTAEIYRAGMKSSVLTSIVYEISRLLQEKTTPGEDGSGEVAGNRIGALCGFLGKTICLIPAVLFNYLVTMQYTGEQFSLEQNIAVSLAQHTLLIIGFSFRKECEFPWAYMIGMVLAFVDGLKVCRGGKDEFDGNGVTTSVTAMLDTAPDNSAEESSDDEESTDVSRPRTRISSRTKHQNPDGASDSDEPPAEDS